MLLVFLKIVNFPKYFWEIGLNFGIPIDFNWEIPMGNTKGISHTVVRHTPSIDRRRRRGELFRSP